MDFEHTILGPSLSSSVGISRMKWHAMTSTLFWLIKIISVYRLLSFTFMLILYSHSLIVLPILNQGREKQKKMFIFFTAKMEPSTYGVQTLWIPKQDWHLRRIRDVQIDWMYFRLSLTWKILPLHGCWRKS